MPHKSASFHYLCDMRTLRLDDKETHNICFDYRDESVMLLSSIHQMETVRENIKTNFFMLMIVEQGHSDATINEDRVHLEAGDMLICMPGNIILSGMVSINFRSRIFLTTPAYAYNLLKDTQVSTLRYLACNSYISIRLSAKEQEITLYYYHLISAYGTFPDNELRRQCIQKLLQAFSYAMASFLLEHGFVKKPVKYSAAESIFRSFAHLLRENPSGRSVQFYAEQLHISPKYFNTICKQVTGKTASTIINEELVNQAKIMLNDPDLSIKQIASTLGFSNQSHFGTFIHRNTGLSPQALRKMQNDD